MQIGELAALEQIKQDSEALSAKAIAIGPFARLDAGAVAARDGKTRGAVTNVFGSQAAFQIETMERALSATDLVEEVEYPDPADFDSAPAWVDALFLSESSRGPTHGADPAIDYAALWALWLSAVPYGIWSEEIAEPSMAEYRTWLGKLSACFEAALERFAATLRDGVTIADIACAAAALIEGHWLNQCLTSRHPLDRRRSMSESLRRSGRLLWSGATA